MSGKEYTAKTVEEALEKALNEMMLTREDIDYEIVTHPSKGFLGFGQRDAVVRVRKKMTEELEDIIACIKEEREEEGFVPNVNLKMPDVKKAEPAEESAPAKENKAEDAPMSEPVAEAPSAQPTEEQPTAEPTPEASEDEAAQKAAEKKVVTKEAMDAAAEKGKAFLSKIFSEMKLNVSIETREKSGYLLFDLKGENLGILIGRRGDTLDALQFLLNLVINEKDAPKVKGIIDVENYRAKREETLTALSRKLAAKAKKTGQKVVLEPMNPQERRIIHMALQNDHRVTTYSEGEEPYRKVVIVPENNTKNHGRREHRQQEK